MKNKIDGEGRVGAVEALAILLLENAILW